MGLIHIINRNHEMGHKCIELWTESEHGFPCSDTLSYFVKSLTLSTGVGIL